MSIVKELVMELKSSQTRSNMRIAKVKNFLAMKRWTKSLKSLEVKDPMMAITLSVIS